jgi:hypothetical protein
MEHHASSKQGLSSPNNVSIRNNTYEMDSRPDAARPLDTFIFFRKPFVSSAMHRLTLSEYLIYTISSISAVLLHAVPSFTPSSTAPCCSTGALLFITFTTIKYLHRDQPLRVAHHTITALALAALGYLVQLWSTWVTGTELSARQLSALHFSLAWYLFSEIDFWAWRYWSEDEDVLWPEYFHWPPLDCEAWYKRVYGTPVHASVFVYDARMGRFWSVLKWRNPSLWIACFSHVSWYATCWTAYYVLRCLIYRRWVANGRIQFALGQDTFFESDRTGPRMVQIFLMRFARIGLAAVY